MKREDVLQIEAFIAVITFTIFLIMLIKFFNL